MKLADELGLDAEAEPTRCQNSQREDQHEPDGREDGEGASEGAGAARPEHVQGSDRKDDGGKDLDRGPGREQTESEPVAGAEDRPQCEHEKQNGPDVVPVENDCAERRGGHGDEPERHGDARPVRLQPRQRSREANEDEDEGRSGEQLEREVVVVRARKRLRRDEERCGARRVLHVEVPVGQLAVQDLVREFQVPPEVPGVGRAEQPAARDERGEEQERDGDDQGDPPSGSANARSHLGHSRT
jgi:hypothetical protein